MYFCREPKKIKMKKGLINLDYGVQTVFGILILTFGIFIFPLILLMPLGGWQMLSALIKGLAWKSKFHLSWFLAGGAYCLALYTYSEAEQGLDELKNLHPFMGNYFWILFFYLIIPSVAAIFYWRKTRAEYLSTQETEGDLVEG